MRRKKIKLTIISLSAVLLIVAAGIFCVLINKNDGVLPAPTDIKIENEVLSWKKVDNAVGYAVTINDQEYETDTNELDIFTILNKYATYEIQVTALGNFVDSFDSDKSYTLTYTLKKPDDIAFIENDSEDGYIIFAVGEKDVQGKLIIPHTFNEKPVTEIYANAFKDCINITSVLIPNSVTTINKAAFDGCINLTRLQLPNELQVVETDCFSDCKKLTNINFPPHITTIRYSAFRNCESLTNITLPNSLVTLRGGCFEGCKSLREIIIPAKVEEIGSYVFSNCDNLAKVTIDAHNPLYKSEGNCIFAKTDDTTVLYGYGSDCDIPTYAKKISARCFAGNTALNSITIPKNIEIIEESAFNGCTNLQSVVFNEGLLQIGSEKFLAENVFKGCIGLKALHLPSTVKYIVGALCGGIDNLESLTVDKSNLIYKSDSNCIIRKEDNVLVAGCAASVIPDYVNNIGTGAFCGCKIKTIKLPENLTIIGQDAFSGSTLEKIEFPKSLISIEDSAFSNCSALKEINLPNGLTKIGNNAFSSCGAIESIAIPQSVTEIGLSAFFDCGIGITVTLPSTVTAIGSQAFDLATIYTEAENTLSGWFTTQDVNYSPGGLPWNGYSKVVYGCTFEYTDGIPYVSSVVQPDKPYSSIIIIPYREGYDFEGWATDKDTRRIVAGKFFTTLNVFMGSGKADAWVTLYILDENYQSIPPKTVLYAVWTKKTD